jgi:two-component system sensor histidine kinase QseC
MTWTGSSTDYEHRLSCQIWALEGRLLGQSEGAPDGRLSSSPSGFSTSEVDGQAWRVYTAEDRDLGIRVMVADTMDMRENLVGSIITALVLPAGLVLPALLGLIWISLGRGLAPLDRVARVLAARSASDLTPLPDEPAAREVQPLIEGLNGLMARVASARESERTFTAFAAHELKTPLSGLKTQAQVAAMSPDPATKDRALAQIQKAVDRTDRMVRQLLDMAAVEAEATEAGDNPASIAPLLAGVVEDLASLARVKGVAFHADLKESCILQCSRPLLLGIAVRNLLENALAAAPHGSEVTLTMQPVDEGRSCAIRVRDHGPGIPADDLALVTRRFVRGRQAQGAGSGLGLAIVDLAMERLGGRLTLMPAEGGGLLAGLILPCLSGDGGQAAPDLQASLAK